MKTVQTFLNIIGTTHVQVKQLTYRYPVHILPRQEITGCTAFVWTTCRLQYKYMDNRQFITEYYIVTLLIFGNIFHEQLHWYADATWIQNDHGQFTQMIPCKKTHFTTRFVRGLYSRAAGQTVFVLPIYYFVDPVGRWTTTCKNQASNDTMPQCHWHFQNQAIQIEVISCQGQCDTKTRRSFEMVEGLGLSTIQY